MMDYEAFKALVREMRTSQKEYHHLLWCRGKGVSEQRQKAYERSKALEKRVDEEIVAAEQQYQTTNPDCIRMANGQTLRQGNLFENQ